MKTFFCEHWGAFLLACCVGIISVLPTTLAIINVGKDFKGIYPTINNDESHYLAKIREVYDGHFSLANPYLKEHKSGPYTQPPLAEMYYAGFAKLFHISVPASGMANDFFLPFIIILLLYWFFLRLARYFVSPISAKKFAFVLATSFLIILNHSLNRPVNPQLSFIFLLIGLHLLWSIIDDKYPLRKLLVLNFCLSLVFGVLIYIYPFYWQTIVVLYAFLIVVRVWLDRDIAYWLKSWFSFCIPALVWSVPFFINAYNLASSSLFAETMVRNGYIYTRIPSGFLNVVPLLFCGLIMYLVQKSNKKEANWENKKMVLLGWALIGGGILLNWQNVITGVTLQFSAHFYIVMILSVFIISLIAVFHINKSDVAKLFSRSNVLFFLLLIILGSIIFRQRGEIIGLFNIPSKDYMNSIQKMAPVLEWLRSNTSPDSAVYVLGKDYDWAIPVYTDDNVYYINYAGIFLMPDAEIENRWVIQHLFTPVDKSVVYGNRDIWLDKFINTYQNKEVRRKIIEFITGRTAPETVLMDQASVDSVIHAYEKFKEQSFEKSLKTYAVDYILVDSNDPHYRKAVDEFKKDHFLEQLVQINGIVIYKVN